MTQPEPDAGLLDRVRARLVDVGHAPTSMREVRMFGVRAVMLDGRMLVAPGAEDLLVRVAPERGRELVGRPGARPAEMGAGRRMGEGWIRVDVGALRDEASLASWLDEALAFHAASA